MHTQDIASAHSCLGIGWIVQDTFKRVGEKVKEDKHALELVV